MKQDYKSFLVKKSIANKRTEIPYQVVRNKMNKLRVLLADPDLAPYVPETVFYSPENLKRMLTTHGLVYVKPNRSRGGERVISIKLDEAGSCLVHYQTNTAPGKTLEETAALIDTIAAGDRFMIQQGIEVLRVNNRPIDLRVNVQKPYKRWLVTGMIAKIAAAGKTVANHAQGGALASPEKTLLQAGLTRSQIARLNKILLYLGEKASLVLNKKYPGLRELGLDVAVDRAARPWILEVNTRPRYHRLFQNYHIINLFHQIIMHRYRPV